MALTRPRLQSGDLVLTCPETSQRASQEYPIRAYVPSAQSANTFTAPGVDATLVGAWVYAEDGDGMGMVAMVKSVASTTATLDRSLPSITGITTIRAWKGPDLPVRVTSADGSAPFDVVSTEHQALTNEPDGYWATGKHMLVGIGGANAGKAVFITGFTAASGTFVVTTGVLAATSVGDLFIIVEMLKLENDPDVTVDAKTLSRRFVGTGRIAADVPLNITTDGRIGLELAVKSLVTAGASAVQTSRPLNIDSLLDDHFTRRSDTGGTISAADATTVTIASSVLTQGGFLLMPTGDVVQVLAVSGSNVAAYGAGQLNHAAVVNGSIGYASTWYSLKDDDFRTRTFRVYRGGVHAQILQGCMPTIKTSMEREQLIRWMFDYMAPESWEYPLNRPVALGAANPLMLGDNTIPTDGKGMRCLLDGVRVNIVNVNVDWQVAPALRKSLGGVNQANGCVMIKAPARKITFQILADDDDRASFASMPDRIRRRKYIQFLAQKGAAPKQTFAIGIPALHITKETFAYDGGQGVYNMEGECTDPVAAGYAAATYTNLPDISVGWM